MMNRRITYLLIAVAAAGCSATSTDADTSLRAASEQDRPAAATTKPAAMPPISLESRENRANRATPAGSVCWAVREVTLALSGVIQAEGDRSTSGRADDAGERQKVSNLQGVLSAAAEAIPSSDALPSAAPFLDKLRQALREAHDQLKATRGQREPTAGEASKLVASILGDIERYPGVQEFAALARADSASCPHM